MMYSTIDELPCLRSSSWSNGSIPGQGFLKKLLNPRLAKSSVKTGQRRVDPRAVIYLFRQRQSQTGNGQREITGISEAEQRDVNNTRQGSRSQAQVQSSKVRESGVKHRSSNQREW